VEGDELGGLGVRCFVETLDRSAGPKKLSPVLMTFSAFALEHKVARRHHAGHRNRLAIKTGRYSDAERTRPART
jgi:hypothetical protein